MKKRILTAVSMILGALISAEAPELKQVMPNSWQKVTRLEAEAEKQFLKDTEQVWYEFQRKELYMGSTETTLQISSNTFASSCKEKAVYRQQAGSDVFYRLICSTGGTEKLNDYNHWFMQVLFRPVTKGGYQILGVGNYNILLTHQKGGSELADFASIDIIESKGRAKGVLFTNVRTIVSDLNYQYTGNHNMNYKFLEESAGNNSFYFLLENLPESGLEFSKGGSPDYFPSWSNDLYKGVWIQASECLFDKKSVFKYSLQNAFDGDPATSFVENTKDDLLQISAPSGTILSKLAIINGYAANENLYYANNRVKTIASDFMTDSRLPSSVLGDTNVRYELQDNKPYYQFIENYKSNNTIFVAEVYKGSKYTDTCIAELNFLHEGSGWLFGDIDE